MDDSAASTLTIALVAIGYACRIQKVVLGISSVSETVGFFACRIQPVRGEDPRLAGADDEHVDRQLTDHHQTYSLRQVRTERSVPVAGRHVPVFPTIVWEIPAFSLT